MLVLTHRNCGKNKRQKLKDSPGTKIKRDSLMFH